MSRTRLASSATRCRLNLKCAVMCASPSSSAARGTCDLQIENVRSEPHQNSVLFTKRRNLRGVFVVKNAAADKSPLHRPRYVADIPTILQRCKPPDSWWSRKLRLSTDHSLSTNPSTRYPSSGFPLDLLREFDRSSCLFPESVHAAGCAHVCGFSKQVSHQNSGRQNHN